ncbi:unnamed protein product, partial [Coregonus sp. 'balchen']
VVGEYGMAHFRNKGQSKGKDYCIFFNSQWARLPLDLNKASHLQIYDLTPSALCSSSDVPVGGFPNRIPMVMRGNCTFYEKVRLAQLNGAKGLLIISKDRLTPPAGNKTQYEEIDIPVALLSYTDMLDISKTFGQSREVAMYAPSEPFLDYNMVIIFLMAVGTTPPAGNKTQYEEIDIPVALLSYTDMLDISKTFGQSREVAMYAPSEPFLDYNMVIIFLMAVGTVAIGGYWAGSKDIKKRYMKHKRDDSAEKEDEETVDVTPIMISMFVVMCCSMLVLLYFFYDHLVYIIIGIFCLASSVGLYSCLWPFVRRLPFGKCRWAWVLQDALGISFCLYMLKTIRLPTFK